MRPLLRLRHAPPALAVAVLLLALGGVLHGVWSHRWELWSAPAVKASADRIEQIPLRVGDWEGKRIETDPLTLPEEMVGRGVSVQYTSRIDGTVVTVYLACGPTDAAVGHTPRVCYPTNGFTCATADLRFPTTACRFRSSPAVPRCVRSTICRRFATPTSSPASRAAAPPSRSVAATSRCRRAAASPWRPGDRGLGGARRPWNLGLRAYGGGA